MNEQRRHTMILSLLLQRPFASVKELGEQVDASAATLRRDIDKLHAQGKARKVFGGIAALDPGNDPARMAARPFDENQRLALEAKNAIAARAETLCQDGETLIVNAGSTCYRFGIRLAYRPVRVYTNSMPLAAALGVNGTCHLIVSGGELHRESGLLRPLPADTPFYASRFFVGSQGVCAEGLTESHPMLAQSIRDLLDWSDQVIALVDSRKFATRARHVACPLSRIHTVVTDEGLADHDARMLEDAGVHLVIAERGAGAAA